MTSCRSGCASLIFGATLLFSFGASAARPFVQPPWTAVQARADKVSIWGRSYELGTLGLPTQIETHGLRLLAGPIRLVAGGSRAEASNVAQKTNPALVSKGPTKAIYQGRSRLGPYALRSRVEISYDGVAEYEIELTPLPRTSTQSGLVLEIPLVAAASKFLVRSAPSYAPKDGRPFPLDHDFSLPFNHSLWMGDVAGGLNWYTDSDEGWTSAKGDRIAISLEEKRVVLRISVLSAGPARPAHLRFGLLATPFRPLARDWRKTRLAIFGNYRPMPWTTATTHLHPMLKPFLFGLDPRSEIETLAMLRQGTRSAGGQLVLYAPAHGVLSRAPEFQRHRREWEMLPQKELDPGLPTQFAYVCPKSGYQDGFVRNLDRMLKRGLLDGVYFDQATAETCENGRHGCGYMEGVERHATQTIRAQREFFRRVRQVFLDNKKEPLLIGHVSNQLIPANYTHLDLLLNGEQFHGHLPENDYIDALPLDMLRVQFSSALMGVPVVFLPEILWREFTDQNWSSERLWTTELQGPEARAATRKLLALLLPSDVLLAGHLVHPELAQRIWEIWATLADADRIEPGQHFVVEPRSPTIHAALYLRPDRSLVLVVGNLGVARTEVRIQLHDMSAEDMLDASAVDLTLTEDGLHVGVAAKDLRIVELRPQEKR